MAALLDPVHLRRHALPAHFVIGLDCEIDRLSAPGPCRAPGGRPHLTAAWRVGANGRPVCAWSADTADPDSPSD